LKQLLAQYVETGKVRYVMREFPIASLHPQAVKGAEAALCAKDQGKYWEMHDRLFAEQRRMSVPDLRAHGEALGLDMAAYNACLDEDKYAAAVKASIDEGARAGVRGTPSFFVGLSASDNPGTIRATKFVRGAQPLQVFQQTIEELLQQGS
jgi:protein-disulfide isomerase